MKILLNVAPWCKEQFQDILEGVTISHNSIEASAFKNLDQTGILRTFSLVFPKYETKYAKKSQLKITSQDYAVIQRCRLLRSYSTLKAIAHVRAMRLAVRRSLKLLNPQVVISESIDQYFHHIIFQEAVRHKMICIGLVGTFIDGYFRISSFGEYHKVRDVNDDEINDVAIVLEKRYISKNLKKMRSNLYLVAIRVLFGNIFRVLYFSCKRLLTLDFHNYHYQSSSRNIFINHVHLLPMVNIGDKNWETLLKRQGKSLIFIPLQHVPEASIDYWVQDIDYVNYEITLFNFIEQNSDSFNFVIKEHPGVVGLRQPSFYKRLKRIPGIVFAPTATAVEDCILQTDATLVFTGSTGFQCALLGKPVIMFADPYYNNGNNRFIKYNRYMTHQELRALVDSVGSIPLSKQEKYEMIKHLLQGFYVGRFENHGQYSRKSTLMRRNAFDVGVNIDRYIRHMILDIDTKDRSSVK